MLPHKVTQLIQYMTIEISLRLQCLFFKALKVKARNFDHIYIHAHTHTNIFTPQIIFMGKITEMFQESVMFEH